MLKEEFEDTRGVIRIRVSKDRQQNEQKHKGQKDNQRSTKHCTEDNDRATRTPLKAGVNSCVPEW